MAKPVTVKAKKQYQCDKCGAVIKIGETYSWVPDSKRELKYEFRCFRCPFDESEIVPRKPSTSTQASKDASRIVYPKITRRDPHADEVKDFMVRLKDQLEGLDVKYDTRFWKGTHPKCPGKRYLHKTYYVRSILQAGWGGRELMEDFAKFNPALPLFFCFQGEPEYGYVVLALGPYRETFPDSFTIEDLGEPFTIKLHGGESIDGGQSGGAEQSEESDVDESSVPVEVIESPTGEGGEGV